MLILPEKVSYCVNPFKGVKKIRKEAVI